MNIFAFLNFWFWEKKTIRGFSFGPLEYQKKYKFSKNIEKESCTKNVQFCTRRRKAFFFDSPCIYIYEQTQFKTFYEIKKKNRKELIIIDDIFLSFRYKACIYISVVHQKVV